ncbi:UNVERIFIED_CONTAM: hypothetical protein Sindi_1678600 [Sesamum indicum]
MDESSGNTTSSPPSRTNSPHDTELSWANRSSDGDEETDSSDMSSDEEKHFMTPRSNLQYVTDEERNIPKFMRIPTRERSIIVARVACRGHFLTNCWFKRASKNKLRTFSALFGHHLKAHEMCFSGSESYCIGANLSINFNHIHPRIQYSGHLFPYFKDCFGAIDGRLIPASVPVHLQNAYPSRHGEISQNVMVVCDFDLMFT